MSLTLFVPAELYSQVRFKAPVPCARLE